MLFLFFSFDHGQAKTRSIFSRDTWWNGSLVPRRSPLTHTTWQPRTQGPHFLEGGRERTLGTRLTTCNLARNFVVGDVTTFRTMSSRMSGRRTPGWWNGFFKAATLAAILNEEKALGTRLGRGGKSWARSCFKQGKMDKAEQYQQRTANENAARVRRI